MPISRIFLSVVPIALTLALSVPGRAATIETSTIENWSLAAFSSAKADEFQSCAMSTPAGDGIDFVLSLSVRNRWSLWMKRAEWPFARDAAIVATLNLDVGRKAPIIVEASLKSDHFLGLSLSRQDKLPDLFKSATTVRVALEHTFHPTVSLRNYARAVDWVTACVARHAAPETATVPDATVRGPNGASGQTMPRDDGSVEIDPEAGKIAPAKPIAPKPAPVPGLIEASTSPGTATPSVPSPNQVPPVATPAAIAPVVAAATAAMPKPDATSPPTGAQIIATALATAARATTGLVIEPRNNGARDLVPNLMQAARRSDFKLLADAPAPAPLPRADAVFELGGFTGAVVGFDVATAAAGMNDVLAHDRIACGGDYVANSAAVEPDKADVLRASTRCETQGRVTLGHFLTLARKGGGYYVVAVTSAAPATVAVAEPSGPPAGMSVGEIGATLDEAALMVTGKF
jgi:hypothetical protein